MQILCLKFAIFANFNPSEPRPIIKTLKFSDQHKKLLDSVLLDKLKLDGEVELEEEAATEEVIRTDTDSNINVMPYPIYAKLGKDQVKQVSQKITMLDHSKAKPIGILRDVLCQVGVTTIIAKILILDIHVDRDVPIVVGRIFLYTCGSILNIIKGTTSTFDGVCHQKFYVAQVRNNHGESDSDDEEEYYLKRDEMGKPFYGPNCAKYLNCDDPLDRALALQEALNPFKKVCVWKKMIAFLRSLLVPMKNYEWILSYSDNFVKKVMEMGNGTLKLELPQVHTTMKLVHPDRKEPINTRPWRKLCSHVFIMNFCIGVVLNNMGCAKEIEATLEIKVYEMGGEEEIFKVANDELTTKKIIKFSLGGRGHALTLLEFARCLGLYHSAEISDEGFEVYFQGGLRGDDNFNARDY
ncbi:hypothetical protein Tco_0752533 [Tanacetum coccineum]|uniref:Uncharacterized protein n=1 Tax=Tanacetum coccineum TaxID=301880 RepID=A0ABQ4ZAH2_9ASTR